MGRRLSVKEMAMIRHYEAVANSQQNRGEFKYKTNNLRHIVCGCGAEGCSFVTSLEQTVLPLEQRGYDGYYVDQENHRIAREEAHHKRTLELQARDAAERAQV